MLTNVRLESKMKRPYNILINEIEEIEQGLSLSFLSDHCTPWDTKVLDTAKLSWLTDVCGAEESK